MIFTVHKARGRGRPRKKGKTTDPLEGIKFNWERIIIRPGRPKKKTEAGL